MAFKLIKQLLIDCLQYFIVPTFLAVAHKSIHRWRLASKRHNFNYAEGKKQFQRTLQENLQQLGTLQLKSLQLQEAFKQPPSHRENDVLPQIQQTVSSTQFVNSKSLTLPLQVHKNGKTSAQECNFCKKKTRQEELKNGEILLLKVKTQTLIIQQKLMLFQEANPFTAPPLWILPQSSEEIQPEAQNDQQTLALISNESLLEAKQRLSKFIQNLHQHRKSELRSDVVAHCSQLNKAKKVIPNYISDQTIMRMVCCRIDKMVKNKKIKKNWSEEDVKILAWIVSKYSDLHCIIDLQKDLSHEDWLQISHLIPGVNPQSCMFKWLSIKKINLSVQHWEPYESNLLRSIVEEEISNSNVHPNSINWKLVAEKQYKVNRSEEKVFRSAKQCREHWNCYLNPQIKKGPWKIQEDIQLLTFIRNNNGEKKWSEIVYHFEGRTENALKNRYTLLIDKQKKLSKSKQQKSLIQDCLERCQQIQNLCTKQRRSVYIREIFNEQKIQQKSEHPTRTHIELGESCEIHESHKIDSLTVQEDAQVVIRFCKVEELDLLKRMAQSKEVRPGWVRNGKFQSQF